MWAVVWRETGEPIGCVGYLPSSASNLSILDYEAEVGCWIARPYWNKGICTEALRLVVEYCFEVKGFREMRFQRHRPEGLVSESGRRFRPAREGFEIGRASQRSPVKPGMTPSPPT